MDAAIQITGGQARDVVAAFNFGTTTSELHHQNYIKSLDKEGYSIVLAKPSHKDLTAESAIVIDF